MGAIREGIVRSIRDTDPLRQFQQGRYSQGTLVSVAGGYWEIDVGAKLPDGTAVYMLVPGATSVTPSVGQVVTIHYATDDPHSGYGVASGMSASSAT